MTPSKEGSDAADKALEHSDMEPPNEGSTHTEPSLAESNMTAQGDRNPPNGGPDVPTSPAHAIPQSAENNGPEVQESPADPQKQDLQEDFQEESLPIQLPIPQKLVHLMSGLGSIFHLSLSLMKTDAENPLNDRASCYSGNMRRDTSDLCYATTNCKIPFPLLISWRRPFLSRHAMRRMTLRLLCGRYFCHMASSLSTAWPKRQYAALPGNASATRQEGRALIFRRPLRSRIERIILNRMTRSSAAKRHSKVHTRPRHYSPQAQLDDAFNRRVLEGHLRSYRRMRAVTTSTSNDCKYVCPFCGSIFNSLIELRQHACNSPGK